MECQTPKEENKLAIRFLAVGEQIYEGKEVTQEAVDHLLQQIQTERVVSGYLSLDEYGEDGDNFLTIDMKDVGLRWRSIHGMRMGLPICINQWHRMTIHRSKPRFSLVGRHLF